MGHLPQGGYSCAAWAILGDGRRVWCARRGPGVMRGDTNPNPKVRKSGAVAKAVLRSSHEHNVGLFLQQRPLLALSSRFLSPSCAPDLGNIATYFFYETIFRSDTRICVIMTSFLGSYDITSWYHCNEYYGIGSKYFFQKKVRGDIS